MDKLPSIIDTMRAYKPDRVTNLYTPWLGRDERRHQAPSPGDAVGDSLTGLMETKSSGVAGDSGDMGVCVPESVDAALSVDDTVDSVDDFFGAPGIGDLVLLLAGALRAVRSARSRTLFRARL